MSRRLPPPLLFLLSICVAACVTPGGGTTGGGGNGGTATAGTTGQGGAAAGTTGGPAGTGGGTGNSAGAMGGTGVAGNGPAGTTGGGGSGPAGASGRGGTTGGAGGGPGGGAGGSSAGRGGSSGGTGGSGGVPVIIPGRGACSPPAGANPADARASYEKWKTDLLTADGAGGFLRVRRPNSSGAVVNSTVSEGIAYGMLLAAYANDRPTFDALWGYSQLHLDTATGLMHWYIGPNGETLGSGAASDSDEDIAFALIMADEVWGSSGGLNYLQLARTIIDRIWQHEVDHTRSDVLTPGPGFGGGAVINISYFAPAFYRAFGRVSGQTANWNRVVVTSYDVLERTLTTQNGNASNGLVPAWSTPAGVPMAPPNTSHPIHHQLDSCRTPFRIAQDYCWNAEPRALAYLEKINAFHTTVTVAAMVDGYNLDGSARPEFVMSGGPRAASFVGGAGVGAMATGTTHATLRNQAYANVATLTQIAGSIYYQTSWTALTLQMMTGLMRDLGAP